MSAPTDLLAMSWPDRLRYAADHDMGVSDLARAVDVSNQAVSRQGKRHGVRLTDQRKSAANAERMRARHADPEFAAANAERMRARNADPEFNPLAALTESERADYDTLKRAGYERNEAFVAIGRDDLIGGAA